jgi:hypothetical protein
MAFIKSILFFAFIAAACAQFPSFELPEGVPALPEGFPELPAGGATEAPAGEGAAEAPAAERFAEASNNMKGSRRH